MKDHIYHLVHKGYCIHVEYYPDENVHRKRILLGTCKKAHCDNPYYYIPKVELPVTLLKTCRQVYHEARNVFYSVNVFRVGDPGLCNLFLRRIGDFNLVLRKVHLNICVLKRNDERQWDNTLHNLAENVKTVQHVYILVRENPWEDQAYETHRHSPAVGNTPFLKGLLELKKLPLKTFELSVYECSPRRYIGNSHPAIYTWTPDQRRAWARSMMSAVLGKEEESGEEDSGEVISGEED